MLAQFQSDDRVMQMMQNSWAATLNPVLELSESIGRVITAVNSTGITLVTNTVQNLTSIEIPRGVWLMWGFVSFPSVPANVTQTVGMISTGPLTQSGQIYDGTVSVNSQNASIGTITQTIGPVPVQLLITKKYYLNAQATFSATAPTAKGTIFAMQIGLN